LVEKSTTMNTHTLILIIHIACGFTALTVGIVPMAAKKGGKLHRGAGKIYAWAMYGVSATALGLFLLNPARPFLQFLLCIGLLGFYLTFSGVRAVMLHRKGLVSLPADRFVAWIALIASVFMICYGGYRFAHAMINHSDTFLAILYIIFGLAMGSAAWGDVKDFLPNKTPHEKRWFFNHVIRMLSAYIATFTAFCVVNVHFLPPILVWTLPGIIGGTIITLLVRRYKQQFEREKLTKDGIVG
jgi:uncharacterized membrane protein